MVVMKAVEVVVVVVIGVADVMVGAVVKAMVEGKMKAAAVMGVTDVVVGAVGNDKIVVVVVTDVMGMGVVGSEMKVVATMKLLVGSSEMKVVVEVVMAKLE
ncbi:hypothetical protein RchiOBHm_Chr7g0237931 [Rosa chinensis]|uniref:Uncharacterized protein n=1 Tax=Rosa chinensis TaxID=74649 RepID=A0A2P6PHB1_ROSCH|nr:hypothetical protein RchiOBHm_Chr7g0237931 [Rosa chinensis]